jgi:glycosyltransferase involved in cell wall biosynthesis
MNATVLIATYNRARILGDAIEAVLTQRTIPDFQWELLIVDNNSRDDTRAVVERYVGVSPVPVRYLFEPQQGKSHALNAGLGQTRGSIVAFTDDDVLVPPDWLATAVSILDRWGADGGGGRVLPKWETAPPSWLASNPRLRGHLALMEVETHQMLQYPLKGPGNIWGANMVFRRSVFDQVGLFNIELGPSGGRPVNSEDLDIVERALKIGRKVVYDPDLVVYHRVPAQRMRMRYFRRWAFVTGQGAALRGTSGPGNFPIFGRPFWMYRKTAALLRAWLVAALLRRPQALELQLDCFNMAGRLWWYRDPRRAQSST